jgi:hypothetical protein
MADCVIEDNFGGRTLHLTNTIAVLQSLVMRRNGRASAEGLSSELGSGAIVCESFNTSAAYVGMTDVTIEDSASAGMGGAVYARRCRLDVVQSTFTRNSADDGGAVAIQGDSNLMVGARAVRLQQRSPTVLS